MNVIVFNARVCVCVFIHILNARVAKLEKLTYTKTPKLELYFCFFPFMFVMCVWF